MKSRSVLHEKDSYGSRLREEMKRSMEKPFMPMNRREPKTVRPDYVLAVMLAVFSFGGLAYYIAVQWWVR